ncbi:hypothetical protein HIM_05189 [Hirsutella minnesotensis 3608]|uniref:Thymocyte nuclear protein 1 n=1 Tax=Hirsutella minnesotensis 3608 TaxID=1043627 RepID=A0A0F7ZUU9_9HYPO|nr:hypothetical protein HIM_05189 [Hirsutella minnesotensis 3608]
MPGTRKRSSAAVDQVDRDASGPTVKRRSTRQAAAASKEPVANIQPEAKTPPKPKSRRQSSRSGKKDASSPQVEASEKAAPPKGNRKSRASATAEAKLKGTGNSLKPKTKTKTEALGNKASKEAKLQEARDAESDEDDVDAIPATNPEAPRHEGEWYWLMKAEPESRFENGIDVRFSIDDLRAKKKPEGWDGIRAYAARNHMRNMNAGDKAFFYHSNCKEPGIVGVMEIVKEFSEDKSARRPGTPYYDPASTKEAPRWSLVHVEFRRKFAVPITLRELRDLGKSGGLLENMQMLKQSRLSVSRVSAEEWAELCRLADEKAAAAGLDHDEDKI